MITHSSGGHSAAGSNLLPMPVLMFCTICSLAKPQYGSAADVAISHNTTPYDLSDIIHVIIFQRDSFNT